MFETCQKITKISLMNQSSVLLLLFLGRDLLASSKLLKKSVGASVSSLKASQVLKQILPKTDTQRLKT